MQIGFLLCGMGGKKTNKKKTCCTLSGNIKIPQQFGKQFFFKQDSAQTWMQIYLQPGQLLASLIQIEPEEYDKMYLAQYKQATSKKNVEMY